MRSFLLPTLPTTISAISPAPNTTKYVHTTLHVPIPTHTKVFVKSEQANRRQKEKQRQQQPAGVEELRTMTETGTHSREFSETETVRPPTVSVAEMRQRRRHNRYCGRTEWRRMSSGQLPLNFPTTGVTTCRCFSHRQTVERRGSVEKYFGCVKWPFVCWCGALAEKVFIEMMFVWKVSLYCSSLCLSSNAGIYFL